MSIDPTEFILPAKCHACHGTGKGHRLYKEGGQFRLSTCLCIRCEGHGIYDVLGDREWETVKCGPPSDIWLFDESIFGPWIPSKKLTKEKVHDRHWLSGLSWY